MALKSTLNRGKLQTPTSVAAAQLRVSQLEKEIQKIEHQIADQSRVTKYSTPEEYESWVNRAGKVRELFTEERELIIRWLDWQESTETLLREALSILITIDDLNPEETMIVDRIAAHFSTKEQRRSV